MKCAARSPRTSDLLNSSQKTRKAAMLALAALSSAAVSAISTSTASGQLYWDRNGTTAGAAATPTGSWNLADTNWNPSSLGTSATQAWASGNVAVFSAGTDGTAAYTVTVPAGVTIPGIAGITLEEGTVTFSSGGTLQLNAGATVQTNAR